MPLFNLKNKDKKTEDEESGELVNLFEEQKEKKDESEESKIVSGVFQKEKKEKETGKEEKILGKLPELDKKIVGAFDPSNRRLKTVKIVFTFLVVATLLSVGFFYAELNPEFDLLTNVRGLNTAQRLNSSERAVISRQTAINQYNYLVLNYHTRELSYLADAYSTARRDEMRTEQLAMVQNQIIEVYENAQEKYSESIVAGDIPRETFVNELRSVLRNELQQLKRESPTQTVLFQIQDYESTLALVGNENLRSLFATGPDKLREGLPGDDTELYEMTQNVLKTLNNEFSHINKIKQNRIPWAIVVNEIERVTKGIDTLYNTGFFEELGGIQYSAYDFDSASNRIILSGRVKRDDGTTFTLIANLIDALEESDLFSNVDNRSYPKSGSAEQGYLSTFRIELTLEQDAII